MTSGVVYRHFSSSGELLYIGSSVNVVVRTNQHKKEAKWFKEISTITLQHFETIDEARNAEIDAIQIESPRENFRHVKNDMFRRPAKKKRLVISGRHEQLEAICREYGKGWQQLAWFFKDSFDQINEIIRSGRKLTDDEIVYLKRTLYTTFKRMAKIGIERTLPQAVELRPKVVE